MATARPPSPGHIDRESGPVITVVLGDPRLPDRSKPGQRFTPDDLDQVARLRSALGSITDFSFDLWDDHSVLLQRLQRERPDFVLNFCDTGFRNEARYELHISAYLEMLGIPFSGSGPVALGLCYDKALVRALAHAHGIPVPDEALLSATGAHDIRSYPVFIKPNRADGSVGIGLDSVVFDAVGAETCLTRLRRDLPQADLLAQEFLDGREFSVGVIGNPGFGFDILPVLEVDYSGLDPTLPKILDYGSKSDPQSPYWTDIRFEKARLDKATEARLHTDSLVLFERLGLRDYGRFDFRCDAAGTPKLLEVNPNPAWCWDGKLAHMMAQRGDDHAALLSAIIEAARRRCFGRSAG